MKSYQIIFLLLLTSNVAFAQSQSDKLRIELLPSCSATLYSGATVETYPSETTEYAPIITNSFSISYLKALANENYLKTGIGVFTTGHKATYSQNPPMSFSGRTDILKARYMQIPLYYVYSAGRFNVEMGISGNIMLNKERIIGSGDEEKFMYETPFEKYALALGAGFYYAVPLNEKFTLNLGMKPQYLITENQMNCGLLLSLDYDFGN